MSGKFMKVKKIFIPTLTAILMVSQLTGCAAVSQSEMLTMINNQQAICIEVAVPINQEDGEEKDINWIELAFLETYPEFRLQFEDTLGITAFGDKGKNGTVYVDLEGNQTNNSTFYYAMMNKKFRDQLSDTETNRALLNLGKENYADVEGDAVAKLAYINAYFNIFNDAEPSYFNGNSTLTRAEFLSGLYRAENPVTELTEDLDFTAKVDPNGESEHTIFAQQMLDKSYLNFDEKSLNEMTFNGEITRAEAIYTLVKTYYSTEFDAVTGKESCFSDAKNGGNIAEKQKFIETDKKTKETTYKDYWKSYELQYAIDNPDKGLPTDLYKALVVAQQKGLITGSECRWDEAITKGEALNFIVKIYESMPTITNADRGTALGETVDNLENTTGQLSGAGEVDLDELDEFYNNDEVYEDFLNEQEQQQQNGNNSDGNTSGGNTSGGNTSGGNTSGGNNSETTEKPEGWHTGDDLDAYLDSVGGTDIIYSDTPTYSGDNSDMGW